MASYISLDLSSYSNAEFADYGDNITNHFSKNPDYPALPVPEEVLKPKLVKFRTYLVDGDQISTYDRKQRDKLRGEIQADLKRNGQYAIVLFPNDAAKQQAIGFPAAKTRVKRTQPPNKPTNVRVRAGQQRGEAIFNCRKQPGTTSLNIKVYTNEPGDVPRIISTTSGVGVIIKDLIPGRQYFFEVQAIGSKCPSDWAGPVDLFAA